MTLCSDRHEEVVSEGRNCVVCLMREHYTDKIMELESDTQHMEETAEGYQERIEILQADLEEIQSGTTSQPVH